MPGICHSLVQDSVAPKNDRIHKEIEHPTIVRIPLCQTLSRPSDSLPRVAGNFAITAQFDNLLSRYAPDPAVNKVRQIPERSSPSAILWRHRVQMLTRRAIIGMFVLFPNLQQRSRCSATQRTGHILIKTLNGRELQDGSTRRWKLNLNRMGREAEGTENFRLSIVRL